MPRFRANRQAGTDLIASRIASISARAEDVFANRDKAAFWLESQNPSLDGRTPLEAAINDIGYQEVEDILTRIEHGVLG